MSREEQEQEQTFEVVLENLTRDITEEDVRPVVYLRPFLWVGGWLLSPPFVINIAETLRQKGISLSN